jgi:hypothetical protein
MPDEFLLKGQSSKRRRASQSCFPSGEFRARLLATLSGDISMWLYCCRRFAAIAVCAPVLTFAGKTKPCVTTDQATQMLNKNICITAHIYDVVELQDGTRFMDVCSPETPDEKCRFTVVSLPEDRTEVGELMKFKDQNVQIRGIVQPMHGRAGMVLSHARQFYGGPPKFKPNPLLARGFDAEQSRPPVNDPNLKSQGGRRSFMNTRDQETLPGK